MALILVAADSMKDKKNWSTNSFYIFDTKEKMDKHKHILNTSFVSKQISNDTSVAWTLTIMLPYIVGTAFQFTASPDTDDGYIFILIYCTKY